MPSAGDGGEVVICRPGWPQKGAHEEMSTPRAEAVDILGCFSPLLVPHPLG